MYRIIRSCSEVRDQIRDGDQWLSLLVPTKENTPPARILNPAVPAPGPPRDYPDATRGHQIQTVAAVVKAQNKYSLTQRRM